MLVTGYWLLVTGYWLLVWCVWLGTSLLFILPTPSPSLLALLCRSYAKAMQKGGQGDGKKIY